MKLFDKNIIVVSALKEEIHPKLNGFCSENDIPIIITGTGKINTCISLMKSPFFNRKSLVVNLGTVGSSFYEKGTVFSVHSFQDRDANLIINNKGLIEQNTISLPLIECFKEKTICSTGDSFCNKKDLEQYQIVDMEGFAIAKLCKELNAYLISIKVVSDNGDEVIWRQYLKKSSEILNDQFLFLIKELANEELRNNSSR